MKLRLGVVLWLLSWVPYGIILGLDGTALTVAWAIEILLGIVGLGLAGTEFAQAVKAKGWKRAPRLAWHALLHGSDIEPEPERGEPRSGTSAATHVADGHGSAVRR